MVTEEERNPWETESGLVDDIDAWITNPRFGVKEEYSTVVVATTGGEEKGLMFLFDLVDVNGEVIGSQGYSVGSGWVVSEDGMSISHAKRKNVVTTSMYGQLQNRVVRELGVDMAARGLPTDAVVWDGFGAHWMQQAHATVGGTEKTGLMPTSFISWLGEEAPAPVKVAPAKAPVRPVARPGAKAAAAVSAGEQAAIKLVEETGTNKEFILKAVRVPSIATDDALMARVMDDGANGFWKSHKRLVAAA